MNSAETNGGADRALEELSRLLAARGIPSAGLMDEALRQVPETAEAALGEATIAGFCARLRESARLLGEHPLAEGGVERAALYRYLMSLVAFAIDWGALNPGPLDPLFSPPYPVYRMDWGAASPDGVYRRALVRDDRSYRVHGRIGNARYFSLDFRPGSRNGPIMRENLPVDEEDRFEVYVGGAERDHWWPLPAGTNALVTREFFDDWSKARRALLRIDCLDEAPPRPFEPRSAQVAAAFDVIGEWIVEAGVRFWLEHSAGLQAQWKNRFRPNFERGGSNLPIVCMGCWQLAPDEALIIELPDPEATFWGLQLASSLVHTLDYANRLTTFNGAQADKDPDGTYRLVLAREDPGVYNWLDTTGLERGVLILRCYQARNPTPPGTRLVKQADVPRLLPDSRRCSRAERRAQIAERRAGVARLICD
jgi:hypothetical protein